MRPATARFKHGAFSDGGFMLNTLIRSARGLVVGLVSVLAIPGAALAEPALWAIKDADSTIYLFGTIHALKPDVKWRSPLIDKAMSNSGDLTLEIIGGDDPAVMQPLVIKYGLSPSQKLSARIGPERFARASDLAKSAGMPPEMLEIMRPWMAAVSLSMAPMIKAGYDPKAGVEQVLLGVARAEGKAEKSFETPEQQVRFFADLPAKTEDDFLAATLEDAEEGLAKIDSLVEAWAAGDVPRLEAEFVTEMKGEYPELYDLLITKRNEDWARQLKTKLAGSGVSFVAVGSGHLVGPESVQAQLAKLGIKAVRVE